MTFGFQNNVMKKVTVSTYRKDKYHPRVVRAFARILAITNVVAPVDVFIEMGNLMDRYDGKNDAVLRKDRAILKVIRPPGCPKSLGRRLNV